MEIPLLEESVTFSYLPHSHHGLRRESDKRERVDEMRVSREPGSDERSSSITE